MNIKCSHFFFSNKLYIKYVKINVAPPKTTKLDISNSRSQILQGLVNSGQGLPSVHNGPDDQHQYSAEI